MTPREKLIQEILNDKERSRDFRINRIRFDIQQILEEREEKMKEKVWEDPYGTVEEKVVN